MEQVSLIEDQGYLYNERFLQRYAGNIITDPTTAIVELVANCWDAYATEVTITLPERKLGRHFKIVDNGKGMTREEFAIIWKQWDYNRHDKEGPSAEPPAGTEGTVRTVFGKNGKGRFASFCFSSEYLITSRKNGREFVCKVSRTATNPLNLEYVSITEFGVKGHGTTIQGIGEVPYIQLSEEKAREVLGSRFLANPAFKVFIGGSAINFNDIPDHLSKVDFEVKGYGKVTILHIDTGKADKTTRQHGIAWWVQDRAVGQCNWSASDYSRILDGRKTEAKRFTFIVKADFLNQYDAVREDWSGFKDDVEAWTKTRDAVQDHICKIIDSLGQEERATTKAAVRQKVGNTINTLSPVSKERVTEFVDEVVERCPSMGENEIVQLATILAKLEQSKSRYGLLDVLHKCEPDDYDKLHAILTEWTIGMAKLVLDEIQNRLRLIAELRIKLQKVGVDEVHELQPLFERGLWMFGAQFESIDFTSNVGMSQVIKTIFKDPKGAGSRNRPDFVALPDASVGFYSRPSYNETHDEDGVGHLVIIDLKTTGLAIGVTEKNQVWKYVKELRERGYLKKGDKVDGYVLGDKVDSNEADPRTEGSEVTIYPMLYNTILIRAEKRLLNLNKKVQEAPFLLEQRESLKSFLDPIKVAQMEIDHKQGA